MTRGKRYSWNYLIPRVPRRAGAPLHHCNTCRGKSDFGGIELRSDFFPGGFSIAILGHDGGFLFTGSAAHFTSDGVRGDVPRGAMQPTGENRMIR